MVFMYNFIFNKIEKYVDKNKGMICEVVVWFLYDMYMGIWINIYNIYIVVYNGLEV